MTARHRRPAPIAPPRPPVPPPGEDEPAPYVEPPTVPDVDPPTGEFSLAELGAATGAHLVRLPEWLAGPDPKPRTLAPWQTGEIPIVRPPRPADEPSMRWAWAGVGALVALFSLAVFLITFGAA